jgi:predicted GNAT family N-acyltransferase
MKNLLRASALCLLAAGTPALAGVYGDDLSRCLVEKTTTEDKTLLVQWIFVAMAQHPSVSAMTRITPEDIERNSKQAAQLLTRLLTETCTEQAKKAIKYEGGMALQMSFQVFGQSAARELFADSNVTKVMAGLEKFVDAKKIEALAQ